MAIYKIEQLEDRLTIHYTFNQPYGISNDGVKDILYESIPHLKPISNEEREAYLRANRHNPLNPLYYEIFVNKCQKTVAFIEHSWQETSFQREYDYNVFLIND